MVGWHLWFLLLVNLCSLPAKRLDTSNKRISVRSLHMCKGMENLPVKFYDFNLKFNETSKEYLLNLKVKVSKEVSNNFAMTFTFLKCDSSGNPDSCEYLIKDFRNNEICRHMVMKNQGWTSFVEHFDKPLKCPIKPGLYTLVNMPVRSDVLKYVPLRDALWRLKLWGFDNDNTISCVDVEIQLGTAVTRRN